MFTFKRKIVRAIAGAAAVTALSLSAFAGATPAAHADSGLVYPVGVYGPGGSDNYGQRGDWQFGGAGWESQSVYALTQINQTALAGWNGVGLDPHTRYAVCAYIPDYGADGNAQYTVTNALGKEVSVYVNQEGYNNEWAFLGYFDPDRRGKIVANLTNLSTDTGHTYVAADAMWFAPSDSVTTGENSNGQPDCEGQPS